METTKFKLYFAWYDLWIGAYWSKTQRTLYVCLIPMLCLSIQFASNEMLHRCINEAMSNRDIEHMLDSITAEPFSEDKHNRMLRKIQQLVAQDEVKP